MSCDFCDHFDFRTAGKMVGGSSLIPTLSFAIGNTEFDVKDRFQFCPFCGRAISYVEDDVPFILFLDIDGVLNSVNDMKKRCDETGRKIVYYDEIEPRCMDILSSILKTLPEISIVITSSWRLSTRLWKKIVSAFQSIGIEESDIDKTRNFGSRGKEICRYLLDIPNHQKVKFLILDDEYHDFESWGLEPHLVMIDPYKGLQKNHVDMIERISDGVIDGWEPSPDNLSREFIR